MIEEKEGNQILFIEQFFAKQKIKNLYIRVKTAPEKISTSFVRD